MKDAAFLAALTTPPGFTRETSSTRAYFSLDGEEREVGRYPLVKFTGHDGQTTIELTMITPAPTAQVRLVPGSAWGIGSTTFETAQGKQTFDRDGEEKGIVDFGLTDSFHVDAADTVAVVDAKIAEQIRLVVEERARHAADPTGRTGMSDEEIWEFLEKARKRREASYQQLRESASPAARVVLEETSRHWFLMDAVSADTRRLMLAELSALGYSGNEADLVDKLSPSLRERIKQEMRSAVAVYDAPKN
jgi:hypothetical protein